MNTPSPLPRVFRATALLGLLFVPFLAWAQAPATPVAGAARKTDAQARTEAKTLAKTGQLGAAEDVLAAQSKFQRGSDHWHFSTGQSLVRLATDLSREGKGTESRSLATQALQRFEQAAATTRDNRAKATFKAAAGHVNERFLGDTPAAIASYRAAVEANPGDKGAREQLTRLENSYAQLRARVPANKR